MEPERSPVTRSVIFAKQKFREEKRRNSRAVSSIFDDEVTLLWQNRLLFGLFRHALVDLLYLTLS